MAKEIEYININGEAYEISKIYEKMGLSYERFVELLERDFYCPTLSAEPTSTTLTYTDTDGSVNNFQVGQPCRWLSNGAYRIALCTNATTSAVSWYILPDTATIATKSDVQTLQTEVDNKVDKVTGKQLSTEDFTTALKDKLNGIAAGATANTGTITSVKMNGSTVSSSGAANLGYLVKGASGEITQTRVVSSLPSSPDATTLYIII